MTESGAATSVATVVFCSGNGAADGTRRALAEWAQRGLTTPSLWVDLPSWSKVQPAGHEVEATVVSGTVEERAPLLHLLARGKLRLLRVVVLHPVSSIDCADSELTGSGHDFAQMLRSRLPTSATVRLLNVVVPATGVSGIPRSLLLFGARVTAVNVIVSPEDRASDGHIDAAVRTGEHGNFDGHAALAVTTVAGLWTGMEQGPFDDRGDAGSAAQHTYVVRISASVAHVEPVISPVAEMVLRPRTDWPVPDGDTPFAPIPARDASALVERVVDQCGALENGAFRFRPYEPPSPPALRTIGILAAFRALCAFVWQRLRRFPLEIGLRVRSVALERAERISQAMTFGDDSAVVVRAAGKRALELSRERLVHDAVAVLDAGADARSTYTPPTPQLWQALRGAALGIVDGSPLPRPLDTPYAGDRRQVVTSAGHVVPDPLDEEADQVNELLVAALGADAPRVAPWDPFAAREAKRVLDAQATHASAEEDEPAEPSTVAAPDAGDEAGADDRTPGRASADAARSALVAWSARHGTAMLWQVGDRVSVELGHAARALEDAQRALAEHDESDDAREVLTEAWRRCRGQWTATLAVVAVVYAVVAFGSLGAVARWGTAAVATAGGAAALLAAFTIYKRVEFRLLHRAERRSFALEVAVEQAVQAAREVVRLSSLYEQLSEWTAVLGAVVHRPFGTPRDDADPVPMPPTDNQPHALNLGWATTAFDDRRALAAGAEREVFRRGWLHDAYATFRDAGLSRLAALRALDEPPDPDEDATHAPNGARAHLLTETRSDRYGEEAYRRGRERVARHLHRQPPERIATEVTPIGVTREAFALSEQSPSVPGDLFFRIVLPAGGTSYLRAEYWTASAQRDARHRVTASTVWAPPSLDLGPLPVSTERLPLTETELPGGGWGIKVVRLDRSEPCEISDLGIFEWGPAASSERSIVDDDHD